MRTPTGALEPKAVAVGGVAYAARSTVFSLTSRLIAGSVLEQKEKTDSYVIYVDDSLISLSPLVGPLAYVVPVKVNQEGSEPSRKREPSTFPTIAATKSMKVGQIRQSGPRLGSYRSSDGNEQEWP